MFRRLVLLWMVLAMVLVTGRAQADGPRTYGVGALRTMALSPDGTRLAAGTDTGIFIYDAATFGVMAYWPTVQPVYNLKWEPTGATLAARVDSALEIRSAESGAILWSLDYASNVAYSPNGAWLAVATGDTVTLRQPATGAVGFTLTRQLNPNERWYPRYLSYVYFLPDGSAMHVCCGVAGPVWVDLATWQVTAANYLSTYVDAFRPDGRQWAMVQSARVGIYEAGTDRLVGRSENSELIRQAVYSPEGARLATGHEGGLVRIWSLGSAQPTLQSILRGHAARTVGLGWSPDGRTLYSADGNTIRAWDAATGVQLRLIDGFTPPVNLITWSADGQRLIAQQGQQLGSWDVTTGQPVQATLLPNVTFAWWSRGNLLAQPTELAASPTGDLLALGDLSGVTLHSTADLAAVQRLPTGYRIVAAVFSPDGHHLATVGNSPFVVVWDVVTGLPAQTLLGSSTNYWYAALAYGVDGHSLYALENSGLLRHWDLVTGASTAIQTPALQCDYRCYSPIHAALHPGANLMAVEGRTGVTVADMLTGVEANQVDAQYPRAMTINPQGTRLAVLAGGEIRVWSLTDGAALATYADHYYSDLAFSPDGASLAASSTAGVVQVWPVP